MLEASVPEKAVEEAKVFVILKSVAKVEEASWAESAVEEAYGKILAVVEVATKRSARSTPSKDPPPETEKRENGEEVPIPTFPVFMTVKRLVVAKAAVEEEIESSVFGGSAWPLVVVEFA